MLVNNPEMYQRYMENKKQQEDENGQPIVWRVPESIEEAKEIEKLIAYAEEQNKKNKNEKEKAADEEFVRQISLMSNFHNIDLDKIGGE